MPNYSAFEISPFGDRRPSDATHRTLSKLELLFVVFAVFALVYLGSLGPKPDPWLETAKAELQSQVLTCSTCSPTQAYDRIDHFTPTPDSAAAISAISGFAVDSELVEAVPPNVGEVPKATEKIPDKSPSEIATTKAGKETKTSSPNIAPAGPNPQVQRRAKPTAVYTPERLSASRYHQVPRGTEKMFDQNWQSRAFLYQ